jgi:hypothetical protein
MTGVASCALALLDRPATPSLVVACMATLAGWIHHAWSAQATLPLDPPLGDPDTDTRPDPLADQLLETPAVVALLTNRFRVPASAITATALDLAGRGWIRLAVVDDELVVVTRGAGSAGDSLRPYEQQVLNHLASRAFNDVSSASTLELSQHRLDRRWRHRFAHDVAAHANRLGLSTRRHSATTVAPGAALAAIGAIALGFAAVKSTDAALADSWRPRALALATLAALVGLAWVTFERAVGAEQTPTRAGTRRAAEWMQYRRRLRARIPSSASVLGQAPQQRALATAVVMGIAEQVLEQLPVAPEDARWAWTEAGDRPHVVRIRYPTRPGYGQHPVRVATVGAVVLFAARALQQYLRRIADGDAMRSLLDRVPGQLDLIHGLATLLSILCWVPIVWGLWSLIAGLVDSVATRERIGLVVRSRRPGDVLRYAHLVNPFADRDRFAVFLAADDGRRQAVTAWMANERTAAPQGAQARVRATPLLGYVRSSEPVGTATRSDA